LGFSQLGLRNLSASRVIKDEVIAIHDRAVIGWHNQSTARNIVHRRNHVRTNRQRFVDR
jgi:hypothetical protein